MKIDKATCGNWILNGWDMEDIKISAHDREILRTLAKKMGELAARPTEDEKAKLWTVHNDLKATRPVLLLDPENGWNELLPYDSTIQCEGDMAQEWEMWLRKELYWGEQIKDDKPLEAVFYLPFRASDSKWGIHEQRIGAPDSGEAFTWIPPLKEIDDEEFEQLDLSSIIQTPEIRVDMDATMAAVHLAREVFDGILTVKLRHRWWWSPDLSLSYSNLRGLEKMMYDFYDYPEKVHEMMNLFTEGYLHKFHFLEQNGLLPDNSGNTYVGSGGLGYTMPVSGTVKLRQMWGFNEAQETSEVSTEMFAEFILPYQIKLADEFGLNCYGCCEGLDGRWEQVKTIPRLRRVSVSQWADMRKMSDYLGSDYIFSYKASPTDLAISRIDEDYIRANLRKVLEYTKSNNNRVEIIMKDNHTLGNNPRNASRWVEIAREEIARLGY